MPNVYTPLRLPRRQYFYSRPSLVASVIRLLLILLTLGLILTLAPAGYIFLRFQPAIYEKVDEVPPAPIAIVFGAGVWPDGEPSLMLSDRLDAAISLYRQGKVQRLLMTGDNSREDYNEVAAMKRYVVERGVPADLVNLDYAGFRTYDSAYRARTIFGINRAILVTQQYHLPRALFLTDSFGIAAVGLKAGRENYPRQEFYNLRELAALTVSWYEVNIFKPAPRFLGEPVDLENQNLSPKS